MKPAWWLPFVLTAACASRSPVAPVVGELDRMLASPAAREVAREVPDGYSAAVTAAERARAMRDDPARQAEAAEEATLVFEEAQGHARLAVARRRIAEAERARAEVDADVSRLEQDAATLRTEVEQRVAARQSSARVQQAGQAPGQVPSAERMATAAELRQQAALLLATAAMLGVDASRLAPVRQRITAAEHAAEGRDVNAALLAASAAWRTANALIEEAHAAHPGGDGQALTTELSECGGFEPRRDTRGVIAVMRGLFAGPRLAVTARQRVETLARVLRSHQEALVRVEAYVGGTSRAAAESLANTQAQNLGAELRRLGLPTERIATQGLHRVAGGTRQDDRVEVILVLPSDP